jgi:pimeloyl-ACP methyl ester carboxylesterase
MPGVSRWADVGGYRVRYLDTGDGPPLLLLASMLVRATSYRPLIARLRPHWRVVAVELPGCGASDRLSEPWSFARFAEAAEEFANVVGIGPATLIGHSNSGPVALELALRPTAAVARLVLVDPIGGMQQDALWRVLAARAIDAMLEPVLTVRGTPHIVGNLVRHRRRFVDQVLAAANTDVLSRAAHVTVPTLVAWGASDHTMPPACGRRFAARIPHAELSIHPGSHDWLITRPHDFAARLGAFRDATPPAASALIRGSAP